MAKANAKATVPPPNLRTALGDITNMSQGDNNPVITGPKEKKSAAARKRKSCELGRSKIRQQPMPCPVRGDQQLVITQPTFSHLK